ncbi:Single-stranded DNA-binding protein [Fusobacterium necrophorum subsp. funduliforme]|uniref:single-stranded DNA-binding protein n=1 Tax=Fusobacterium necrophorum TaxID=859 RepID=UPI002549D400|nr:single-stranded DNA-binding protein [Fusobacterium necrophorum]MDK4475716.1 single-stranded DNA-binding protein [Fusobacterium necrophorum]
MQKEMLNINGNLINEVEMKTIQGKDKEVTVANFTLFRKMGKEGEKKKEYINCNVYGEKTELTKEFEKGDFIHVYGYYKEVQKENKTYKNFIVRHVNKIDKEMEKKKEQEENKEE